MNDCLTKFLKGLRKILNRRINRILLLVLSLCPFYAQAQYNLRTLLELSHKNEVKNTIKEIDKEILEVNYSGERNLIPAVDLSMGEQGNFGRSFDPISGEVTPRDSWYNSSNFSLKIQQRLTSLFQRKINKKIHETNLSVQDLTNLQNQKNTDIEIVNNYYECLRFRENLELSLFLRDKLTIIYHGYHKLYEFKKIDTVSLLGHKREVLIIDKEILTYLGHYLKSLNKLKGLVGFNESEELMLDVINIRDLETTPEFPESDHIVEKKLLRKEQELDSLTWRKSKNQILPDINFYSSFGSYYSSILNYQYDFWDQMNLNNFFNVGVTVNFSLFSKERKNITHVNKLKTELSRNKALLQQEKMEEFWKEIKLEYESGIKLFNMVTNIKNISYQEFYLNQSKYSYRKIAITQFLESYVHLKDAYAEFLNYKYALFKQRDILKIVSESSL